MATTIKKGISIITNNPMTAVAGGVGAFLIAKKYKMTNKYYLVGTIALGVITGALISSRVKAIKSQPTKKDIK